MATGSRGNEVLERGDIYFFFRPKVEREHPRSKGDVQRFYIVLSPEKKKKHRLIIVGRKELPEVKRHERDWAFVDLVTSDTAKLRRELEAAEYETKTRGERELPAARPAGEGVYAIVRHDNHTHLAYALELPEEPDRVQRAFDIGERGSFVISVKNPEAGSPPGAGLRGQEKAKLPQRLMEVFHGRRFADVDPPDFLDHEGTELILVGARETPQRELGVDLGEEREKESTADIFRDLHLDRREHPLKPLFEGKWE